MSWHFSADMWKNFKKEVFLNLVTILKMYMILPMISCEPGRNFAQISVLQKLHDHPCEKKS